MKTIKYINTFAILIPFLVALVFLQFGIEAMIYGLYFTMITGFIQVILGIMIFIKNPKDKFIKAYLISVVLFFALWYFNVSVYYLNFLTNFLVPMPLVLAIYLSVLIYKRKQL